MPSENSVRISTSSDPSIAPLNLVQTVVLYFGFGMILAGISLPRPLINAISGNNPLYIKRPLICSTVFCENDDNSGLLDSPSDYVKTVSHNFV